MKIRTKEILAIFDEQYGTDYICYLDHENALQLLIATMLSAQCTDERVNQVTKTLFQKYESVDDYANANIEELEHDIRSTGFYRNKAKNIINCAQRLRNEFHGQVPSSIEDLTSLAGVGRKTANVIRGNIYHIPSIVVDTHVMRIANRLQFTNSQNPEQIEQELMKEIPREHWILINIQWISFGREICNARSPKCEVCRVTQYCREKKVKYVKR